MRLFTRRVGTLAWELMTQTPQKKRDLPIWAGILVVAIGLSLAGWFIWSQVSGFWSGPSGVFQIPGANASNQGGNSDNARRAPAIARGQAVVVVGNAAR